MSPPRAIVLAAGNSTRIASIAAGLPKPLIAPGGVPILIRNLRWLSSQGVEEVWVNLHYRPEAIRTAVGDGSAFNLKISFVYEPKLLGTAGAVHNIAADWQDSFAVIYGDNLVDTDLAVFARGHRDSGAAATIGLFDRGRHPHTGVAGGRVRIDAGGTIESFAEGAGDETSPLVNAGIYMLEASVVARIPAGRFYDFGRGLFPAMLADGQLLHGELITGYCLGLDTPESYAQALRLVTDGKVVLH